MGIKSFPVLLIILLFLFARPPLCADSGGSFGGFDGFDSSSGGGFDSSWDSGGGYDSYSSGSDWSSGESYSSGDSYTDYSGSDYSPSGRSDAVIAVIATLAGMALFVFVILGIVKLADSGILKRLQQAGSVLKYQVGFYGSAKKVQQELRALAEKAGKFKGRKRDLMNEAILLIKRYQHEITYGNYSQFKGSSYQVLENMFRRMAIEERAKYREELIRSEIGMQVDRRKFTGQDEAAFKVAECIVVTLIVVSKKVKYPKFPVDHSHMLALLDEIAGITESVFAGFEVIWTPENPQDAMLEEELIYKFPTLIRLV